MDVNRVAIPQPQVQMPAPAPVPVGNGAGLDAPAPVEVQSAAAVVQIQSQEPARSPVGTGAASERDSGELLQLAVREVNTIMASHGRHLNIRMHEATGRRIVAVYDSASNEVVREIPPESVLDAHASMLELAGLFMDTRG